MALSAHVGWDATTPADGAAPLFCAIAGTGSVTLVTSNGQGSAQVERFEPSAVELAGLDDTVTAALTYDGEEAAAILRRLAEPPHVQGSIWLRCGRYAVLAASMSRSAPATGHVDLVAVHPDHWRQGVGRTLLLQAERELAGLGAGQVSLRGNPPCYAWPGIDVRYTPALCLAQASGYECDGAAQNMTADLSGAIEPVQPPAGVRIDRVSAGEVPRLAEWIEGEFNATWAAEMAQSVERGGVHAAWRDGRPVAFAAYGANRPSWFGPMGTAAAARGGGIGAELLRRCLADQAAGGVRSAQIGWAGPIRFYANAVGAVVERVFWTYHKQLLTA